ncbi:hypothetical protein VspSTUT11_23920 [Vibrio sp. STUT-A11]|nr:hypothetical protein VspSTUT11_23920 [Vibrio sp. STUT-A11]
MLSYLSDIEHKVNAQLSEWLQRDESIIIECHGENLTDSRYWKCDLGEGEIAVIPCGGTHASHLNEFGSIHFTLRECGAQSIEMHTEVKAFLDN